MIRKYNKFIYGSVPE